MATILHDTICAREFLRVSFDRSGRERSNDEQRDDNRAAWSGWRWGDPYQEVGSASKYATKERDDFPRLLADLESGRFGAHCLVMWEATRGSRKVSEWLTLIESCEQNDVRIAVTCDDHIYNPANTRDRKALIEAAADGEYESAKTSARVRRDMAAAATQGRPHGRIPYGYRRRYDERTRQLVAQELHELEAKVVRELFDRLRRGHSLKAIARDFEARGVRNRSGRPFTAQHLRVMAKAKLYSGEREHNGETHKAVWPALVDRPTFLAVQRLLADPARRTSRSGRAKHRLSGIAVCDVCDGDLAVEWRGGRPIYRCHTGRHVTVDRDALDHLAEEVIVGYLSRRDHADALTADDGDDAALDAVRAEIASIRAERDQLYADVEADEVSATIATHKERGILARLHDAEQREAELSTPSRLRGLIQPGKDVAQRLAAAPLSVWRDIARILLTPDYLGQLRVQPAKGRRSVPVIERVRWDRAA